MWIEVIPLVHCYLVLSTTTNDQAHMLQAKGHLSRKEALEIYAAHVCLGICENLDKGLIGF